MAADWPAWMDVAYAVTASALTAIASALRFIKSLVALCSGALVTVENSKVVLPSC
jgi:hypothetical protein